LLCMHSGFWFQLWRIFSLILIEMIKTYLNTVEEVYKEAAESTSAGLCCTTSPIWELPGLKIPREMIEMNYGCGSTVHPKDLSNKPQVLYLGVGGGMELLQFSYFNRTTHGVKGIDPVSEMVEKCSENLIIAENINSWFRKEFVELKNGTALDLPIDNDTIDVVAQNCLFNIFHQEELLIALTESYRVLKNGGKLVLSDPICETAIPSQLQNNEKLRAVCLSGAIPLNEYLKSLSDIGFGTIEIRSRKPYRILDTLNYPVSENILLESVEVCAIKNPLEEDGPCIFSGREAIYFGKDPYFDDHHGHVLYQNQPLSVCDKTAVALNAINRPDIYISDSTWFYSGGGCC